MKKTIHKAQTRGFANHGWLKSHHTFSFADYRNAERVHFGMLRVLNDDWIEAAKGFGTHPHENMEIVTIPLEGALRHKDSMGHEQVITKGEVQRMSAGTGLTHSEYNDSKADPVTLLQIWVFPNVKNVAPSYEQKRFLETSRENQFQLVVAPLGLDGAVSIQQDAFFSLANLKASKTLNYEWKRPGHGAYFFVIEGQVTIAGESLERRDAMGVTEAQSLEITSKADSEILVIEVPMQGRAQ